MALTGGLVIIIMAKVLVLSLPLFLGLRLVWGGLLGGASLFLNVGIRHVVKHGREKRCLGE